MSEPIAVDTTLDQSGGTDDSVEQTASLSSDDGAFQWQVTGDTTDVDIHFEARLSDTLPWKDYLRSNDGGWTAISADDSIRPVIVDLGAVTEVRVRIINQDSNNTADVTASVKTE